MLIFPTIGAGASHHPRRCAPPCLDRVIGQSHPKAFRLVFRAWEFFVPGVSSATPVMQLLDGSIFCKSFSDTILPLPEYVVPASSQFCFGNDLRSTSIPIAQKHTPKTYRGLKEQYRPAHRIVFSEFSCRQPLRLRGLSDKPVLRFRRKWSDNIRGTVVAAFHMYRLTTIHIAGTRSLSAGINIPRTCVQRREGGCAANYRNPDQVRYGEVQSTTRAHCAPRARERRQVCNHTDFHPAGEGT